jgi:hypothetical protein
VAVIWREFQTMVVFNVHEPVQKERDMITIVAHRSSGALYRPRLSLGSNVNGMNLGTELLSDQDGVI